MKYITKYLKPKKRNKIIKEIDAVFALLIKIRDNWTCKRCNKSYPPFTAASRKSLHCSHYFSRRFMGTRFDFDNCDTLCYGCHKLGEGDKQGWYAVFKRKQLGEKKFELLEVRAYGLTKYSLVDLELLLSLYTKQYNKNTTDTKVIAI